MAVFYNIFPIANDSFLSSPYLSEKYPDTQTRSPTCVAAKKIFAIN